MNRSEEFHEIREVAESICDGEVTPEQIQKLEILLAESSEAKRFYLEYIGMHSHLKAATDPKLEIVMRRLQVDEVIVRRRDTQGEISDFPLNLPSSDPTVSQLEGEVAPKEKKSLTWLALTACVFLSIALVYVLSTRQTIYAATLLSGELTQGNKVVESVDLQAGHYLSKKVTRLKLKSGDILEFEKGSYFLLQNNSKVKLKKGAIAVIESTGENLNLYGANFRLETEGGALTLENKKRTEVFSTKPFLLYPLRWRPKHYWSFDSKSDRALDQCGNAHGIAQKGAKKVKGLLGEGAYYFDNSKYALVNVGSGGGTAPATGSFAVVDGVTIEALIQPEWSGEAGDLDEIFRKDQTDGELRMLLSFQNDKGKPTVFPVGDVDESIGFGLYLVGHGYQELKLPLDGKKGRPSLAELQDGTAHHIVATYDVASGLKAIYIDGIMHASYRYQQGTRIISGGSGIATIGNSPNSLNEPYHGVIDEVAFYDFGLPHYMIKKHYAFFLKGLNYFGMEPSSAQLQRSTPITLPKNKVIVLDPLCGLPISVEDSKK
jgi:hypothetical protein